jgi:hypothetical protein
MKLVIAGALLIALVPGAFAIGDPCGELIERQSKENLQEYIKDNDQFLKRGAPQGQELINYGNRVVEQDTNQKAERALVCK